ncbi:hypothetical protein N825_34185 [Skermanella stibiiresistens SB22]|uniref:Uncharacterized protein n=1 Tax=Skermanella stibiiresistens SB22 TaxID=1385369 RepID=W9GTQ1_9PROT|nr:hypothetical protein N825_34185 [Skermanella stibiiresistens SB22]
MQDYDGTGPVHGYAGNREQAITCYLRRIDPVDRPAPTDVDCDLIDGTYRVTAARSRSIQ